VTQSQAGQPLVRAPVPIHGQPQGIAHGVELERDQLGLAQLDSHRGATSALQGQPETNPAIALLGDLRDDGALERGAHLVGDDALGRWMKRSAIRPSATHSPAARSSRRSDRRTVNANGRRVISTRSAPRTTSSSAWKVGGTDRRFAHRAAAHLAFTERSQDRSAFFTAARAPR